MAFKIEITPSPISIPTCSSRCGARLCLLLQRTPTVGYLGKLERRSSLSLLFSSSLISLSLLFPPISPSHRICSNMLKWDVPSLPHVTSPLALLDFPLSSYPILWISILSSCDTCPTWVPLRLLSDLLSIFHMAPYEPSDMYKVSVVTLGASKNMKFRLSRNLTKFDGVTRFRKTIPTVKSVSSSEN